MKYFWIGLYGVLGSLPVSLLSQPAGVGSIQVLLATEDITCTGLDDGKARLTLLSGATPVLYQWQHVPSGLTGTGGLTTAMPVAQIANLRPGDYRLTLTDATGMDTVLLTNIFEPPLLTGSLQVLSGYNGFQVACADSANGSAQVLINGGTPPYDIQWSSGETGVLAQALPPGPAFVEVRDAQDCPLFFNTTLSAPPLLSADLAVEGEKCLGENTGRIEITQLTGGLPPYAFSLNGGPPTTQILWENLDPGTYFLNIRDANNCILTEGIVLPTGLEFVFDAGPDQEIFTGDTLTLAYNTGSPVDSLLFFPAEFTSYSGQDALLFPRFNTDFLVVAYDSNGCAAEDIIRVTVHRRRDIYAPNVFSPDADLDANRFFTLFSGGGVRHLDLLQIFDRQGRLVFEGSNLPADQPASGWDGRWNGDIAPAGVYFWHALIRYTDHRVEKKVGDVTLLR